MGAMAALSVLILSHMSLVDAKDSKGVVSAGAEKHQQPPEFNIHKYYKMADPQKAAVLLLEDAQKHGIDIDAIPQREIKKGPIKVPYAKIEPIDGDKSFVETISKSVNKALSSGELVCIIQFSRAPSVREIASVLSLSVRYFTPLHTNSRIVKIPVEQLTTVANLPFVRWVGPYLPSYKYDERRKYDYSWYFSITAFIEDDDVIKRDLAAIGVEVTMRQGRYTSIRLTEEQINTLANIWWVERIYQSPRWKRGKESRPDAEYGATPQNNPYHDFSACDSRKLISMRNPLSQWCGRGVLVGINDSGCDWDDHDELKTKVNWNS
jgi:hypothetical protein